MIWCGRFDSAIVLSGTKVHPRPNPCSTPDTSTGPIPMFSEKPAICHSDSAVSTRPARMISLASTRPSNRPTTNIAIIVPMPRGEVMSPVVITG